MTGKGLNKKSPQARRLPTLLPKLDGRDPMLSTGQQFERHAADAFNVHGDFSTMSSTQRLVPTGFDQSHNGRPSANLYQGYPGCSPGYSEAYRAQFASPPMFAGPPVSSERTTQAEYTHTPNSAGAIANAMNEQNADILQRRSGPYPLTTTMGNAQHTLSIPQDATGPQYGPPQTTQTLFPPIGGHGSEIKFDQLPGRHHGSANPNVDGYYVMWLSQQMLNNENAKDNAGMIETWQKLTSSQPHEISFVCDAILRKFDVRCQTGNALYSTKSLSNGLSNHSRLEAIGNTLREQKSVCKRLLDVDPLTQLVEDPLGAAKRVTNNRRVNMQKKSDIECGRVHRGVVGNGKGSPLVPLDSAPSAADPTDLFAQADNADINANPLITTTTKRSRHKAKQSRGLKINGDSNSDGGLASKGPTESSSPSKRVRRSSRIQQVTDPKRRSTSGATQEAAPPNDSDSDHAIQKRSSLRDPLPSLVQAQSTSSTSGDAFLSPRTHSSPTLNIDGKSDNLDYSYPPIAPYPFSAFGMGAHLDMGASSSDDAGADSNGANDLETDTTMESMLNDIGNESELDFK